MPIICLMVRENHKMVREMSGKSQGILWGLIAGHPDQATSQSVSHVKVIVKFQNLNFWQILEFIILTLSCYDMGSDMNP